MLLLLLLVLLVQWLHLDQLTVVDDLGGRTAADLRGRGCGGEHGESVGHVRREDPGGGGGDGGRHAAAAGSGLDVLPAAVRQGESLPRRPDDARRRSPEAI